MRTAVYGIRPGVLAHFYRWRLREHGSQELLAAVGIAVGVALVFGVLVANASIAGSARELVHGLQGQARLQLAARSGSGFPEQVAQRASQLPGVLHAASSLRGSAALLGRDGSRRSIQLVGVSASVADLGGAETRDFGPGGLRLSNGLALPAGVASAIGARTGDHVTLLSDGRRRQVLVGSVLGASTIGPVAFSPIAIVPIEVAQHLLDRPGRVTQLLIQPRAGAEARVARGLRQLAAGRLSVLPADAELRSLDLAAQPNDRVTTLFAAIGAMIGVLLAGNAMLLTIPERRRFVAELSTQGFEPRQILLVLAFEALLLGSVASLAGVALGDLLSRTLFDQVPAYLSFAFPIGTQRIVTTSVVLLAFGGGLLATVLASLPPALDLRPGRPIDAVVRETGEGDAGEGMSPRLVRSVLALATAIAIGVTAMALALPSSTLLAGIALALASIGIVPAAFGAVTAVLKRASVHLRGTMLPVAVMELRATMTRSVVLASVVALTVYGSVAIDGARNDLVHGLDRNFGQFLSTADLWVTTGGDDLTTDAFDARDLPHRLTRLPGVAAVRAYQGSLLDVGARRLWIVARPPADPTLIPASELRQGTLGAATRRIRRGGWGTVSDALARERHLHVGDEFALPTPTGSLILRIAAVTSNLGWPPGAVILSSVDYARAWATHDPSALEIDLKPGVTPAASRRAVQRALGPASGLRVQTTAERRAQYARLGRQGLRSLMQISTLLLVATALAVAAALGAAVWERRTHFAALKVQGFDEWHLWRSLVLEAAVVLGIGCAVGALLGIYGHALASRYLQLTTGFPAPFSLAPIQLLKAIGLVGAIALLVLAHPGWIAARVPARSSFQE